MDRPGQRRPSDLGVGDGGGQGREKPLEGEPGEGPSVRTLRASCVWGCPRCDGHLGQPGGAAGSGGRKKGEKKAQCPQETGPSRGSALEDSRRGVQE